MQKIKMKYQEEIDRRVVKWIESNPNYFIIENFEGVRKRNSRVILLVLLSLVFLNYLIYHLVYF
jgi:hypothetical protein